MNITDTETKADVVSGKQDSIRDSRDHPVPKKQVFWKPELSRRESGVPSDRSELSTHTRNEPVEKSEDKQVGGKEVVLLVTTSSAVTNPEILNSEETTQAVLRNQQNSGVTNPETNSDSIENKKQFQNINRDSQNLKPKLTPKVTLPPGDNNEEFATPKKFEGNRPVTTSSSNVQKSKESKNSNNKGEKQFDLKPIQYTTIFLRFFAPGSTTTTTTTQPKLGYVQQNVPGQKPDSGDTEFNKQPPPGDKPQAPDVEPQHNTTTIGAVTPSLLISSLSTQNTTDPTLPIVPVIPSSTTIPPPPPPVKEVPTNATILVLNDNVRRVSSSGTGVKPPIAPNTQTPATTTAQSGLTAGGLVAIIVPILVIILLLVFLAFLFVRRRKQFNNKRKRLRADKDDVEERIELNTTLEDPKNISTDKLYAKVDKSRKSRISYNDETTPLTTVLINGGQSIIPENEDQQKAFSPESGDMDFVDNDLYERDSEADKTSNAEPLTVANYPEDDETYEIPEDVVNQLEQGSTDQLSPPTPPTRTSSSPRNSTYFSAATPPVPHRHSSLALTSVTPPLPPRHSSLLSTLRRPESKSFDMLDIDRKDTTPKLPARQSLRLPPKAKSSSPENKRATFAGHFVPMPITNPQPVESTSESEMDSSSESDFEELPPPREHAPPLPEGAEIVVPDSANGGATDESEYLEPISLKANDPEQKEDSHDYDPVYIPSNPGASHIAHLVDNTNYLKGARNRSPSKASINPYEEIQFGADVYADVDESTMTTPPLETSTPTAPPRLTPRSSRQSDLMTPPQLSPRSPNPASTTPLASRPTSGSSETKPDLPPRSPIKSPKADDEPSSPLQNGLNLPKEPRYSGLLLDSEDELNDHEYTPLDYEDNEASEFTNGDVGDSEKEESTTNVVSKGKTKGNSSNGASIDDIETTGLDCQTDVDYDAVPIENNEASDEIYEPIEGADRDGIYEAIEFGD